MTLLLVKQLIYKISVCSNPENRTEQKQVLKKKRKFDQITALQVLEQ